MGECGATLLLLPITPAQGAYRLLPEGLADVPRGPLPAGDGDTVMPRRSRQVPSRKGSLAGEPGPCGRAQHRIPSPACAWARG